MKNKYPSKYSNGKQVTAAQFIAEMVCERIAKKNKKDLHYRFWVSKEWEKEYKGQITAAHKLLIKYDSKDIIDALLSNKGSKIYSLRAPHLIDIIEQIQNRPKQPKLPPKNVQRNLLEEGKITKKSYNILDKLKEIDDGFTR